MLVVDDDASLISEYVRCLGEDFEPDDLTTTLTDIEKVLLGEESDERGAATFEVHSRNQGEAAVEAVEAAIEAGNPYSIVFLDIRMPPGMDGIEAGKRIRLLDPNVNVVVVTDSVSNAPENLGKQIPPADKVFFFQKPFHAWECRQLTAALCGKWHADMALRQANEELEQRVEERTAALQKLAYFDIVTRLPNQLILFEELKALIERAEDTEGDTVVVLVDIDRFSFINETMDYDAGTELLRSIGNRLSRTFCDDAGHRMAVVGRFGADEFAMLVPGIENDAEIGELTELVKETVEAPFLINGRDLFLKASIGVSWHPVHGRDAKSVFRCAEAALHRSIVPPSDFIPLSEEMGISDVLFESIMRSVCADVAAWREKTDWKIPVSVNLSAHQLRNRDLVSLTKGILQSAKVDKKLLNLELTETVLLEDLTVAQPVLDDLAAFGVGIHIDDFGTGYSSAALRSGNRTPRKVSHEQLHIDQRHQAEGCAATR